jgi:hypothetical protein
LGVLTIFGWLAIAAYLGRREPGPPPDPKANQPRVPLPPAADDIELQGLADRTLLTPRDNPGYLLLLEKVRDKVTQQLVDDSRRDVLYGQIQRNPARYRGIPIHIEGTVLRVQEEFAEDSVLFPKGVYYEAWVGTEDSQPLFWHIIFDELPPDLPVGNKVGRRIAFDGYFFKLHLYMAADKKFYSEPLLIGRIAYLEPLEAPEPKTGWNPDARWIAVIVAVLGFGVLRWAFTLRRAFRKRTALPRSRLPVNDTIEPEMLAEWLDKPDEDDSLFPQ